MAENEKYNLKDELLKADEELKDSTSIYGISILTQPRYNNSMRTVMFTSHVKQFLNLLNPDFAGVFTNGENLVGKYSSGYKEAKHDYIVYKKIEKFSEFTPYPLTYVMFVYNEKKKKYDVWTRKEVQNLTEMYAYQYNNEVIDGLKEGDFVPKGQVLYKSTSYDDYMNYGYGKNVKILYTNDPYTAEDGCEVSDELAKDMLSIEANTISISVNQNDFLLNLYGDDEVYKPLPGIGEFADGEVAVKRTLFKNQLLTDFKDSNLKKISDADVCYFGKGQVIDMTIYCNNPDIEDNPFNQQILQYLDSQNRYYREIKETCEEIIESGRKYTQNVDYLYKRACEFLDNEKGWKKSDTVFGNLLIEITIKKQIPIYKGQKITPRYGNKSVVAIVKPKKEMPYYYDSSGKKVYIDLLLNLLAIVNRTTAFPLFELSINFVCNKVREKMKKCKTHAEREHLLFSIIEDFNEIQARDMRKVYNKLSHSEQEEYIESCINKRIFINQSPVKETKPIFFRLLDIYKKYDFLQPYDIYIHKWGREIKCLNPAYIGEMYVLKLKQTATKGFSVRSLGSINGKSLPERSHKNKSFTENKSSTPIRFGEFESLNFAIGMLPIELQLFHLIYRTCPEARKLFAKSICAGEDFVAELPPTFTSVVGQIFSVILKSLGIRMDLVDEDDELREYDDEAIKLFELNGVEYLCTEYQFLLTKRKKAVEKEILEKMMIIDKDELEKLVIDTLRKGHYVIGPDEEDFDKQPAFMKDTVLEG